MKIAICTEFFPASADAVTGGVEQRMWQLATRLPFDALVICSHQPGQPRRQTIGQLRVVRVGPSYAYTNQGAVLARFAFAWCAFWLLLRTDADVLEGSSFIGYLPAALAGRLRRIPRMATYHECWIGRWIQLKGKLTGAFGEIWERTALAIGFDAVVAVSQAAADQVRGRLGGTPIDVIPNGVAYRELQTYVRQPPTKPTILFIGRLVPGKRLDVLIRATARLGECRLVVAGDGPERAAWERLAQTNDIHAQFLGHVASTDALRRWIAAATAFCLPSEIEGFGMSAVEAMAQGVPTVLADIPALREVAGSAALLCEPGNVEAFASALRQILTDAEFAERLSQAGRARARDYYWDDLAGRYAERLRILSIR